MVWVKTRMIWSYLLIPLPELDLIKCVRKMRSDLEIGARWWSLRCRKCRNKPHPSLNFRLCAAHRNVRDLFLSFVMFIGFIFIIRKSFRSFENRTSFGRASHIPKIYHSSKFIPKANNRLSMDIDIMKQSKMLLILGNSCFL